VPAMTVDLRAQVVNIKVTRGDRWSLSATFPDNLTGFLVRGQVRPEPDSPDELAEDLTVAVTDAANGRFVFGQQHAFSGVYDIEIVTEVGELGRTWIRGRINAVEDVTRV
jgi:hypothetical protein